MTEFTFCLKYVIIYHERVRKAASSCKVRFFSLHCSQVFTNETGISCQKQKRKVENRRTTTIIYLTR